MSKKAIFDHNKAKAILSKKGVEISMAKTSKEFDTPHATLAHRMKNGSELMCFLLEFCNKHKLTIQEVITVKKE